MKKLNQSYNLFPVYESVEVMHIVVKSGTLTIGRDKQDRIIIKGNTRAIELIDIIYNQNPNSNPTEGHISYFNACEFIFPKDYTFNVSEADNDGVMVSFHIYKKELTDFNGCMHNEVDYSDLPFYPDYVIEEVDGNKVKIID